MPRFKCRVCFFGIAFVVTALLTIDVVIRAVPSAFAQEERQGLFGPADNYVEAWNKLVQARVESFERDDEVGRALAEEQATLEMKYDWGPTDGRSDAASIAESLLIPNHARPGRILNFEFERNALHPEGEVHGQVDIAYRKLKPMPSFTLNEEGQAARIEEIRQEFLREERVNLAINTEFAKPLREEMAELPQWLSKNLIVRVEFRENVERVSFVLDDPPAAAVHVVDQMITQYIFSQNLQAAIASARERLDELKPGADRRTAEFTADVREREFRRRYGYEPQPSAPDLYLVELHGTDPIYEELIIVRARREVGAAFERAAADDLRAMREVEEAAEAAKAAAANPEPKAPAPR